MRDALWVLAVGVFVVGGLPWLYWQLADWRVRREAKARTQRIEEQVMGVILALPPRNDFVRPMGVNPPLAKMITTWDELAAHLKTDPFHFGPLLKGLRAEKGLIKESRFTVYATNEREAIDALTSLETADDE